MSNEDLVIFERRFASWELEHPRQQFFREDVSTFISGQVSRIVDTQIQVADRIIVSQERIESGIDKVAFEIERVGDGLEGLASAFEWGFSKLIWQLEQQRETLKEILDVLQKPLDTQAKELKKRAEDAYKNGWIDEALEDFLESEKKNRYDFTIHINLGNIYFFEKKTPETALRYYENAEKYARPKSPYHASFALLHIGLIRYLQEDFQKAYEATLKALELTPDLYEVYYQHAQYCANLEYYYEAVEHLEIAITGDRYYCVKADSEKDFDVMKEQLRSLFELLKYKARDRAEREINTAYELVQDATSYGVPDKYLQKLNEALNEAEDLFKRDSYFDYLDASYKVRNTSEIATDSSIKYISNQISEIEREYNEKVGECKKKAESFSELIVGLWYLLMRFPIIPSLVMAFYRNLGVGIALWFLSLFILGDSEEIEEYTFKKYIEKYEKSYENKLAILEDNILKVESKGFEHGFIHSLSEDDDYMKQGRKIADWLADAIKDKSGIDIRVNDLASRRVVNAFERAVRDSPLDTKTFEIKVPYFTADANGPKHLQISLEMEREDDSHVGIHGRFYCEIHLGVSPSIREYFSKMTYEEQREYILNLFNSFLFDNEDHEDELSEEERIERAPGCC